jgi:S1-C subfamily serine protease
VVVTGVADGSTAEDAGFNEGDIIRQVNRLPVSGMAEFTKLVAKSKADKSTLFLVERGDARILLTVKTK